MSAKGQSRAGAKGRSGAGGRLSRVSDPEDVVYDHRLGADISLYGRDRGTPERATKGHLIEVGGRWERRAQDVRASPLACYYGRRLLAEATSLRRGEENELRHEAAQRFLGDWERGGRRPRLTQRLNGLPLGRVTVLSGAGREDWRAFAEAYIAMDMWADCVESVVCFDEWAGDWARRVWPRMPSPERVGMRGLRLGLERLQGWYSAVDRRRWPAHRVRL